MKLNCCQEFFLNGEYTFLYENLDLRNEKSQQFVWVLNNNRYMIFDKNKGNQTKMSFLDFKFEFGTFFN